MKALLIIIFSVIMLSSCSPERRLHRLIALHPELVKNDTIRIQDTTFLPEIKIDTIVHESKLQDTITITKEKLTVRIHRLRDTIYIAAHQEPDTIIITKEIPVDKIMYKNEYSSFKRKLWELIQHNLLLSAICMFLMITIFAGFIRRK